MNTNLPLSQKAQMDIYDGSKPVHQTAFSCHLSKLTIATLLKLNLCIHIEQYAYFYFAL